MNLTPTPGRTRTRSLVAALPDDSLAGLPDVQIYGMRVKAKYIAATAAATVFLGLRGLLVGAIIAMYLLSNPEGGAARPTSSAGPSRSRPGAAAAAPTGPPSFTRRNPNAPPPAAAAAPKKDSFGGGARGHKLGSSKEG